MAFTGLDRPTRVVLPGDAVLVQALALAVPGWERRAASPGGEPDVTVRRDGAGWRVVATSWPGGESLAADPLSAANALSGLLVDGQLTRCRDLLGLHAAAAVFAAGAVVCLGHAEAGKSTRALRLAARGHTVLGDDRVLVDAGRSDGWTTVALGLAAKARVPLPPGEACLAVFVERH
ncbi:MAG: hypothetical protein FJX53_00935 [Alphaproteobacteria bacterium]|nr:hypothetical protein [Alphaproteobacteria bacterium]